MTAARIVFTTTQTAEDARQLATTLVEEGLAACATLVPAVESIYRWQGAIQNGQEVLLLLKTDAEHIESLRNRLHSLHRYEIPEFLVVPVESGSEGYLTWLESSLTKA